MKGWRASRIINPLKSQIMKRILLISFSVINQILMSSFSLGQPVAEGSIVGLVRDSDTEMALPFANLVLEKDGKFIDGTASDFTGSFTFKKLDEGHYDLSISYLGYEVEVLRGIQVSGAEAFRIEAYLCSQFVPLQEVVIQADLIPLIEKGCCTRCTFYCGGSRHCCVHRNEELVAEETADVEPPLLPKASLLVYPNPTSSVLSVELKEVLQAEVDFKVFDKTGRLILVLSSKSVEKFSVPMENLPNGIYFLSAVLSDQILTERFVVAR